MVQAKQGKWAEKREAYRARESDAFIQHHADHMAAREAEVRDHALDAIDEAITKFRSDMRATKTVRQADGTIAEEPVMLIDAQGRGPAHRQAPGPRSTVPSVISEHQGLNVTSEALPSMPFRGSSSGPVGWPNQPRRSHRSRDGYARSSTELRHPRRADGVSGWLVRHDELYMSKSCTTCTSPAPNPDERSAADYVV